MCGGSRHHGGPLVLQKVSGDVVGVSREFERCVAALVIMVVPWCYRRCPGCGGSEPGV